MEPKGLPLMSGIRLQTNTLALNPSTFTIGSRQKIYLLAMQSSDRIIRVMEAGVRLQSSCLKGLRCCLIETERLNLGGCLDRLRESRVAK